ncbi:MAG: DNA-3-methyladenine glycosylase [Candidatus Gastranaerophilales bacterium]|nr:DNA-3-methyladenine glycosylase [Candidatus Gastranaerophilales bacterium]
MEEKKRLTRSFFTRDGITVAKELLGKVLVHETSLGPVRGIITEVESYMGVEDKGSHTYGGRRTERTEPMYHIGGTSYVYLIYGMYRCMNIAAGVEDIPQAVLLRSVAPADEASLEKMLKLRMERLSRRKKALAGEASTGEASAAEASTGKADSHKGAPASIRKHLADGPGKLCIAMGITGEDNDVDMVESKSFYVTEGIDIKGSQIQAGKRIGIDYAEEAADYLWRFYITGV